MDPGTATLLAAGVSTLGNNLGYALSGKKETQPYKDPNQDYLSLLAPSLSARNVGMSTELETKAREEGAKIGAEAMKGSSDIRVQEGAIDQARAERSGAAQLGLGVAGQYAQSSIGLETKSGEGKLAAELTPVQTAKQFAENYGEGTIKLAGAGTQAIADISKEFTKATGEVGRTGIESQTALGGKQLDSAGQLGLGAQTGTTQLGQQTIATQGNLEGEALKGEQSLLQPTANALASAGQQTLAGQNELALRTAYTNLDIAKGQENTRNQLALQRGGFEGQLALKRFGAQQAAGGHARFA